MENRLPTLGFIGTGTLSTALITGFCERANETPYPIVVSPRSEKNAKMLAERYPDRVTVANDMQDVLDRSDWAMLAILPDQGEAVFSQLRFRKDHKVINFLTDKTLPQVRSWIGDTDVLVHMIPLTFNAFCNGPIILSPPQKEAAEIYGHIGEVLEVEERYHAALFSAVTGCEVSFYMLLDTLTNWCVKDGVPKDAAAAYVTKFFYSVCEFAKTLDAAGIHRKADEATPGGVNYMVKDELLKRNAFSAWEEALAPAINRLAENIPH